MPVGSTGLLKEAQVQAFDSLCQDVEGMVSQDPTTVGDPRTVPRGIEGAVSQDPDPKTSLPASVPATPPPPAPCSVSNATTPPCMDHTLRTLRSHRTGLTVLMVLMGVVFVGFVTLLLFKVFSTWRNRSPKNQRYKSVSRYFPFAYEKQSTEVIIPAVGMPKTGAAERQVLLNDSDEDEL